MEVENDDTMRSGKAGVFFPRVTAVFEKAASLWSYKPWHMWSAETSEQ